MAARKRRSSSNTAPTPGVVAYLRVSTGEQADSGLGIEAQRRVIRQYAELYKVDVVDYVIDDGFSGKDLDRPGIRRVLQVLEEGKADGIVIAKLDRLTRSTRDAGDLVEKYFAEGRLRLVSVGEQIDTTTAAGRLVLNVLTSVAQWEREAIGERTKAALKSKRERGHRSGGIPYGFELDPKDPEKQRLRKSTAEQAAIAAARALHKKGVPTTKITTELNEKHPKAARGKRFYQPFVWKLVQPA